MGATDFPYPLSGKVLNIINQSRDPDELLAIIKEMAQSEKSGQADPQPGRSNIDRLTEGIELQHRLPPEMWQQIETMFKERPSYQRLLGKIKQLPCFPDNLSPQNVYEYITNMWKYYRIKPEQLNLDLTFNSPLLQKPHSS